MKLVTVEIKQTKKNIVGLLVNFQNNETGVINLLSLVTKIMPEADKKIFENMLALIENSKISLDICNEILRLYEANKLEDEFILCDADFIYRSPVPQPPQVRDCLLFEEHLQNSYDALRKTRAEMEPDPEAALNQYKEKGLFRIPEVWYELPVYYKANRNSVIGHNEDIIKPKYTNKLDFELEFGCYLNSRVKDINEEEAERAIFGYSIFNDISARDIQSKEMQGQLGPTKGKDFDTGNVIGPCIVTADSIDPYNCQMIARINGDEVSRGNTSTISRSFANVVSYMSNSETLVPGEFIGSGTVGGGCGLEIGRFLEIGDVIELEVEGIGVLTNKIISA